MRREWVKSKGPEREKLARLALRASEERLRLAVHPARIGALTCAWRAA